MRSQPWVFGCRYNQIPDRYNSDILADIENRDVLTYLQQIIPDITGIKQSVVMSMTSGCFINEHTDANRGKAAYVYQLTKDWHPMYGGVLHFVDNGIAITPTFNMMSIMKTGDTGMIHCVTPVSDYVLGTRLTVAGILY